MNRVGFKDIEMTKKYLKEFLALTCTMSTRYTFLLGNSIIQELNIKGTFGALS